MPTAIISNPLIHQLLIVTILFTDPTAKCAITLTMAAAMNASDGGNIISGNMGMHAPINVDTPANRNECIGLL